MAAGSKAHASRAPGVARGNEASRLGRAGRGAGALETEEISREITRFAQETRAVATDEHARRKFLGYWRWARFGIVAIRLLMLPAVRREAERRWAMR
jgi:hypothetical protein